MAYQKGEVLLVPFPFTNLSRSKRRPALVVSTPAYEQATGSFVVAMITSVRYTTPYDYEISDWQGAGLLDPSWVRMKLATLDPSLVAKRIGVFSSDDVAEVDKRLESVFGV